MTPFDPTQNFENPNGPPTTIEQDDLIAFHLNELPRQQVRAVRRALQTNPALQAESVAIATTLQAFPKHEPALPLDTAALDRMWRTLEPSLPIYTAPPAPFPRWAFPAIAGSALVATTLLVALHHSRHTQPPTIATIGTTPSAASTRPAPTNSTANLSAGAHSNTSTPNSQIINHAWTPTSAPLETASAEAPPFPAQSPNPLTPTTPSTPLGTAPTQGATSPPSNPTLSQTTAETPAQASTQAPIHPGTSRWKSPFHHSPTTELTLAMFGNITAGRSSSYTSVFGTSQITQTATPAVGALASFRQQFRPRLGYRLTTTYFSPSFNYFNGLNIRQQIYEVSATYVAQGPHHRRLTTSVEAGASLLNFRYRDDYISPTPATTYSTYRPAAVVGVGAEYAISRHWGLRAEYRALLYRPPYVANPGDTSITPTTDLTFSSNPILGITYRFGANGAD